MLNKLPKSTIIGVTVVLVLLALVVIFRTVAGGGENSTWGSKEDIMRREAVGKSHQDLSQQRGTPRGSPDHSSPAANSSGSSAGNH